MPGPGWIYGVDDGICRGPASYELAEQFKRGGGVPITIHYHGCPSRVVVRQREDLTPYWRDPPERVPGFEELSIPVTFIKA